MLFSQIVITALSNYVGFIMSTCTITSTIIFLPFTAKNDDMYRDRR